MAEKKGIGLFSLRELAAQVGMRAPSLYQYFATKNDLYDAMFSQGYHDLRAHLGNQEGCTGVSRAEIKEISRRFFIFVREPDAVCPYVRATHTTIRAQP